MCCSRNGEYRSRLANASCCLLVCCWTATWCWSPLVTGFSIQERSGNESLKASTNASPGWLLDDGSSDNEASGPCGQNCMQAWELGRPVCGTDGRTYPSSCDVWQAKCKGHHIRIKHKGKCSEGNRCWMERAHALASNNNAQQYLEAYIPECLPDGGGYAPVQCHKLMGYCWCVTENGQPIPGTSLAHRRPQCTPREKKANTSRRSSRGKKKRQGCSPADRYVFNKNLIDKFTTEHNRLARRKRPPAVERQDASEVDKEVIVWKFTTLDSDGDGVLSRMEFKALRQLIKKVVKPRRCAKTFTKFCDVIYDRKISRDEWIGCFGVDSSKFMYSGFGSGRSSGSLPLQEVDTHKSSGKENEKAENNEYMDEVAASSSEQALPVKDGRNCLEERKNVLESSTGGSLNLYIPECNTDGSYKQVQCYTQGSKERYCFCVKSTDGSIIEGSFAKGGTPDCEKVRTSPKVSTTTPSASVDLISNARIVMKGCTGRKKANFLQELMDELSKAMFQAAANDSHVIIGDHLGSGQTIDEKAARWKFAKLDVNRNHLLDKQEWKAFKAWALLRPSLKRKCGKRLPRFCDANSDRKISMDEWLECLEAKETKAKRRGPNPFKTILKSD
ncbi:unnamed protein product [Notodromas monacha]|uniref:SPARC-related modular calcium-binding protein 1 n=1 Tax=Notodromas monacha TaxID=399045 RepID=A0A7R9GJM2_9CRUS|nr:unnamed protein product [Notodromas monacha]CAG0922960.1 unnamed protein product [Notodromas monacha]